MQGPRWEAGGPGRAAGSGRPSPDRDRRALRESGTAGSPAPALARSVVLHPKAADNAAHRAPLARTSRGPPPFSAAGFVRMHTREAGSPCVDRRRRGSRPGSSRKRRGRPACGAIPGIRRGTGPPRCVRSRPNRALHKPGRGRAAPPRTARPTPRCCATRSRSRGASAPAIPIAAA